MIKLSNGKYIDMSKAKELKPEDKVHKVMREFKEGKLKSSSGQTVTSRDQALAIAMSESGLSKNMIHDIAIEYDTMEKARPTKYIKRVPKPSGKGYYYFYTREQIKDYKEKGIVPKEEKGGNFWDKVKSFFGANADEKVNKLHEIVSGAGISVTKDSLAEHLAEYLNNKDKWDSKFRGEKKEKGEPKPKTETAKSEKKESGAKKEGSKWNNNLMKFFSNQYGLIGTIKREDVKKEKEPESFQLDIKKIKSNKLPKEIKEKGIDSKEYKEWIKKHWSKQPEGSQKSLKSKPLAKEEIESYLYTEKEQNKLKSILENEDADSDAYKKAEKRFDLLEKEMNDQVDAAMKSYGITADEFVAQVNKYTESKSESKDNFETMPEGDDTYIIKNSEGEEFKIEKLYPEGAEKYSPAGFSKNLWQSYIKLKGKQKWIKGPSGGKKAMFDFIKDQAKSHNATITDAGIEKESEKEKKSTVDESINKFKIKRQLEDDLINSKPVKQSILDMFPDIKKKWEGRAKIEPEDQKPSATEALKEIERTERFPEVPTYAEVPEGFKKVEGTTAPKGYEFYRNGSPLSKDYKQVLVKDKSKVEALKEELGKKKSESKEREITVFGKQQKVKTKPIELNLGYGHPFEIAKREFGSGRSDWIILESSTGLKVGSGKTQKEAISNAESMIKNYTPTENEFKKLIDESRPENIAKKEAEKEAEKQKAIKEEEIKTKEKINKEKSSDIYSPNAKKLSHGSINMKNISDEKERKAFETMNVSNMITDGNRKFKPLFSYSSEGQDQGVWTDSRMMIIDKKVTDEIYNTNKQREFNRIKKQNPSLSDDEIIFQITEKGEGNFPNYKQVIPNEDYISKQDAKFTGKFKKGDGKDSVNIAEYSDGENTYYFQPDLVATIKNKFPNAKMHLNTSGSMSPAVFKVGNEIKAVLMPMQRKDDSGLESLEKALSNLRHEIMFKAQPTKYIKKIPNPNGKGYIYFYTQAQVKEYEKTGKLPDDQKKKPEVKESAGKGNIEILKESIKKVASIFADALSAKDAVQPTGQGVEQTGENIAQKSKDKKRLEKQRDIRKNTKKNTPEEKPLNKAKDLSKLTRKHVTDKNGHIKTVWVRIGENLKRKENKGESIKDNLNEQTLKNNVKIIEGKNYNKKQIVSDTGYKFVTYNYIPKNIEFKNPMVNDMNQNLSNGWTISSLGKEDDLLLSRVLQGLKPMSNISFWNNEDRDKYIKEKNINNIDKTKFDIEIKDKQINITKKGKVGELFNLEKLKEDYNKAGINIDIEKIKNKDMKSYFKDWDSQDKNSKIEYWETGLILGYPIENTISLYKGGIK